MHIRMGCAQGIPLIRVLDGGDPDRGAMTTALKTRFRPRDPGELIAGVPVLLGFHPTDSLILITLCGSPPFQLGSVLRADLLGGSPGQDFVDDIVSSLRQPEIAGVVILVVGGRDNHDHLAQLDLVNQLTAKMTGAGIAVLHALWAQSTHCAAPWACYQEPDCTGQVPDPASSEFAAASVVAGTVIFPDRQAVVDLCRPDDENVLCRRSQLLDQLIERTDVGAVPVFDAQELIASAVDKAQRGIMPSADTDIVDLAFALTDVRVRDACLCYVTGPLASAAEQLWLTLTRACPDPERAEAAVLLAYFAYVRGDGVLTGIALDQAEQALPGHRLARLLRIALLSGLPPDQLIPLAVSAAWPPMPGPPGSFAASTD